MYIYESHLGGLYTSEFELDFDELYCEECGDSDELIGEADTLEEAVELFKNNYYCEMYENDYFKNFLVENFSENEEEY